MSIDFNNNRRSKCFEVQSGTVVEQSIKGLALPSAKRGVPTHTFESREPGEKVLFTMS